MSEKSGNTPAPCLGGFGWRRSTEPSRVAIKHGLVVVGAVAFATLWALGIVAEVAAPGVGAEFPGGGDGDQRTGPAAYRTSPAATGKACASDRQSWRAGQACQRPPSRR